MSQRNDTLQEQMKRLQNSMQRREKRRDEDRQGRMARAEFDGGLAAVYGEGPGGGGGKRPRNATGGVQWGSAAAAVAAASQLGGPQVIRCELCNASFGNNAQMQQHLEGPAHRKAVERATAERQRRERLGRHCDAAEAAVAAAAWASGMGAGGGAGAGPSSRSPREPAQPADLHGGVRQQPPSGHPQELHQQQRQQQQQQQQNGNQRGTQQGGQRPQPWQRGGPPPGRGQPAVLPTGPPPSDVLSHEELLQQARGGDEILSIDGWVPPTVLPIAAAPQPSSPPAQAEPSAAAAPPLAPGDNRDAVGGALAQQQGEEVDEDGDRFLGGLIAYGDDSDSDGSSSSDGSEQLRHRVSSGGLSAAATQGGPEAGPDGEGAAALAAQGDEGAGLPALQAAAESGDEESASDSDAESGGGQPVSFFTF